MSREKLESLKNKDGKIKVWWEPFNASQVQE